MEFETVEAVIEELQRLHGKQSCLCEDLEILADSLPSDVDRQFCLIVARHIVPIVKQSHQFEEATLFPIFEVIADQRKELHQSLNRLQFEHWEVECFAEDLVEVLRQFCSDQKQSSLEKLPYMLRGFFEGLRRHLAFEAEYLIPLLKDQTSFVENYFNVGRA